MLGDIRRLTHSFEEVELEFEPTDRTKHSHAIDIDVRRSIPSPALFAGY
jgi:hypothetical protein